MRSTMANTQLTISSILRHGQAVYADSTVTTYEGGPVRRASFAQVGQRTERLAKALGRLGVNPGDRIGTFCWNHQEHVEAYLAIPSMGAVLHTLNIRLFPEQLAYVINHAEDRFVLVDDSLVPLLARVRHELKTVEGFIVVGNGDASDLGDVLRYEELLAGEEPGCDWPDLDEDDAAAMCYTSGTTGDPKGVVYSHRSTYLHSMSIMTSANLGLCEADNVLVIVPMFHANAWGTPYAGWLAGSDLLMPQRYLQAEPLAAMIGAEKPTLSCGVPTIWNDLLQYGESHDLDLSSLRMVTAGGSAVPRSLMERYEQRYGLVILQGWGMTETSPVCTLARPPVGASAEESMDYRDTAGRIAAGVQLRIVAEDGTILPRDGSSVGEIEVTGPWITAAYYGDDSGERFHDGWLRTGDVASVDAKGFVRITDRTKDVIKSGGEWISSVELENAIMAHPAVLEAAVIGVPDPKWDERPLACVVLKQGANASVEELKGFLGDRVAKWWLPERWTFVEEIPKTSVGKFDKKVLRASHNLGELEVCHSE
ncbi:MAG: long-chain fatty acid--CoA ligase [Acidimicrobiales bacterium]